MKVLWTDFTGINCWINFWINMGACFISCSLSFVSLDIPYHCTCYYFFPSNVFLQLYNNMHGWIKCFNAMEDKQWSSLWLISTICIKQMHKHNNKNWKLMTVVRGKKGKVTSIFWNVDFNIDIATHIFHHTTRITALFT